eukprot:1006839_1
MAHIFCIMRVALMSYLFSTSTALEFIVNPTNSTVSCGANDDCTVICNATDSCQGKTFYFNGHSIDVQCSATDACKYTTIFTSNVESLTASMTGPTSFVASTLYTSGADIDIHVQCGPSTFAQECFGSRF